MHKFPDIPPMWLLATLISTWVLKKISFLTLDGTIFAWFGIVAGFALIAWSAYWFRTKNTTIHPHGEPEALIVEGPYNINRNPIYAGMILIAVGYAMLGGSLLGLLPVGVFFYVLNIRFISPEEETLREKFGAKAETYFENTRRW